MNCNNVKMELFDRAGNKICPDLYTIDRNEPCALIYAPPGGGYFHGDFSDYNPTNHPDVSSGKRNTTSIGDG